MDLAWLPSCLDSMLNQWYPHWELFFIGESLLLEQIAAKVKNLPGEKESRIFLTPKNYSDLNQARNEVLATVTGEFLIFPTAGDLLAPAALLEVVKLLNRHPEADIIYADEDTIDSAGARSDPFFKPDWSPDLALSMPYTGPFTVFRTARVQALGGFRAKLGQAAQYDLLLRTMEQTTPEKIHHLAKILYHRRVQLHQTKPADEEALREGIASSLARPSASNFPGRESCGRTISGHGPHNPRAARYCRGFHHHSL